MPKKAFLVGFTPMTRVVIDVPEDFNPDNIDASPEIRDRIIAAARESIASQLSDKLDGDNCDRLEEDLECPYEPKYVWAVFNKDGCRLYQYPATEFEDLARTILAKAHQGHPGAKFHLERVEVD